MTGLSLVDAKDPILTLPIPEVFGTETVDMTQLSKDMFLLMWNNGGIGLAAPQVGLALRMFVMGSQQGPGGYAGTPPHLQPGPNYVCINPMVISRSDSVESGVEGCLSFPSLWLNIKRPSWVLARYRTLNGELIEQRFEGLLARCYVHELDHLNGIVFTSYVGKLSLKMSLARQKKNLIKGQRKTHGTY